MMVKNMLEFDQIRHKPISVAYKPIGLNGLTFPFDYAKPTSILTKLWGRIRANTIGL